MSGKNEEFNMEDLENDDELQNELRSLGWCDDEPPSRSQPKPSAIKIMPKPPRTDKPTELTNHPSYSVNDNEGDDERDVEFTDEDMMDPELLSQLRTLDIMDDEQDEKSPNQNSDANKKTPYLGEPGAQSKNPHISISADTRSIKNSVEKSINMSISDNDASTKITSAEAKSRALACQKEGNKAEALKWLKMSKAIEQDSGLGPIKKLNKRTVSDKAIVVSRALSTRLTDIGSDSNLVTSQLSNAKQSAPGDRFSHLENALNSAMKDSLNEAQLLLPTDRTASAAKVRNYKRYQQELNVLASRRGLPGAEPAPFKWLSVEKDTVVENLDIGDDQLVLVIEAVSGLEASLVGQSSRSITISYDLGLPRETPITGKITGKVGANGCAVLKFQSVLSIIKRCRSLQTTVSKKKATFEVALTRGVFFSNLDLGTATLSLADLNTKCECGGTLPLEKSSSSTTGKKIISFSPGSMTVYLKLRKPVATAEVVRTLERTLVLEGWPSLDHVYRAPTPATETARPQEVPKIREEHHEDKSDTPPNGLVNTTRAKVPSMQSKNTTDPAALSEREKSDPCSAEFLESNDVLEAEICADSAAIAELECRAASTLSEEEESLLFTMKMRVQLMTTKLNMLVSSVQQGQLSLEQYLERVKARLGRDRLLAQYLISVSRQEDPPEGTTHHIKSLTKRINIMQSEISTAEADG